MARFGMERYRHHHQGAGSLWVESRAQRARQCFLFVARTLARLARIYATSVAMAAWTLWCHWPSLRVNSFRYGSGIDRSIRQTIGDGRLAADGINCAGHLVKKGLICG